MFERQASGDHGPISRTTCYFQGTADLLHSLAHAENSEVARGGKMVSSRLETASVVMNLEANRRRLKNQTHLNRAWGSIRDGVAHGFPRHEQKRTIHGVRKGRSGTLHFHRHRNSLLGTHRSRELGQRAGEPILECDEAR